MLRLIIEMLKQVQHDIKGKTSTPCHPEPGPEPCPETSSGSIEFDLRFRDLAFDPEYVIFSKFLHPSFHPRTSGHRVLSQLAYKRQDE